MKKAVINVWNTKNVSVRGSNDRNVNLKYENCWTTFHDKHKKSNQLRIVMDDMIARYRINRAR
ncbi:uncharacterized protein ASCRUDRAFT_81419 [Ascoidea rubescens DSM 1968]|uniref:Uncharacterized protein n=1 Tax=Ascoidea rubescens DSM 1968 TaxID=1344418 RepID=A0A1D2VFS3_9ASCO|nr:hypothetical protein ASCRUDRAFT_81419 [Ascoidea rubescens DSM 1968]ODV60476.1 hypothetical protein ASCRUDRAFT_81419 [Ascoidea rubescens DSM 1968]